MLLLTGQLNLSCKVGFVPFNSLYMMINLTQTYLQEVKLRLFRLRSD